MKTEFTKKLEAAIRKSFSESGVSVSINTRSGGNPSCLIDFTIGKDNSEYKNWIIHNDDLFHHIWIYGFDENGNTNDTLSVESNSGSITVKSTQRHLAFGRIKTGWRNFKATPDKTIEKIENYFFKVRQLMNENFDQLTETTQKLMLKKGYKN